MAPRCIPLPEERCQMMGLPPGCVAAVKGSPPARRAAQNSLIGNGFHIPTIMALLCMMPALLDAKISAPLIDMEDCGLDALVLFGSQGDLGLFLISWRQSTWSRRCRHTLTIFSFPSTFGRRHNNACRSVTSGLCSGMLRGSD